MDKYLVKYSDEALRDLRDIFEYISYELKEPAIALAQVKRILNKIRSLDTFPKRCKAVEWEPWHSCGMRQMPVDNFIAFYITDGKKFTVYVVRIFYGKRDIQSHVVNKER